ncbi:Glycosyl hydrolase family 12 [Alteromonadaceae bacterium Bs31]|nr:Glycosyl hydrolase family 12 [Alteromonadaceae bacterium Bs31]
MRIIVLISIIILLSCKGKPENNMHWEKPESITIDCSDYFNLKTSQGVLNNNVWNKNAANSKPWSQCLEKRVVEGENQFGWSWSWPTGRRVIYAYPQIKIGASPWAPEPKMDTAFPLKISELKKIDISHELEISTNGDHNIATTMWLVNEAYKGDKANTAIIAAELMIWTYSTAAHFDPAGQNIGELTVGDTQWQVWYQNDWQDQSGANSNQWAIVSFRNKKPSMSARIPAMGLLQYALRKGLISKDLYIADVELGNEIMSGSGISWVKEFKVHYEKEH